MRGGTLRTLVSIQRKGATTDALGQRSDVWTEVAKAWADIRYQAGLETLKSGAQTSIVSASIRIRVMTGLDSSLRVVAPAPHGTFEIEAILPGLDFMDLVCKRVGG